MSNRHVYIDAHYIREWDNIIVSMWINTSGLNA
jgi:hypothetical protein